MERLEEIKAMGCAELGVPKCRVALVSVTHLWIPTRSGAFSPALQVQGAPFQPNFDAFYIEKSTAPVVMEDARLDPRCAQHPGVVSRPNLRFYVGLPMISRNKHLVGVLYLWASYTHPRPPPEQLQRLEKLAAEATAALQWDMFEVLGAKNSSKEETDKIELPCLWIDTFTPKWQVLGANDAWERLTGVSGAVLGEYGGLLEVMIPSNEQALVAAVAAAVAPATEYALSIPAIVSPCSPQGASQQFVIALKPASAVKNSSFNNKMKMAKNSVGPNVWAVEVHARIQAAADSVTGAVEICDPRYQPGPRTAAFLAGFSMSSSSTSIPNSSLPRADSTNSPYHTSANSLTGGMMNSNNAGMQHGTPPPRDHHSTTSNNSPINTATSSLVTVPATIALAVGPMHIPPRLASLQLGPLLGKGSYGSVYVGMLGQVPVAVKVMQQAAGPEVAEQYWAATYEAMIASDLQHENLVRTIDWCGHADCSGGVMWIVQELCDEGSLSKAIKDGRLRRGGKQEHGANMKAVLQTAVEVAKGMQYLHSHDVLHGDLSSNNVMFVSMENDRGFQAKINDFGLSRSLGKGQDNVSTRTVGTISHMPRELIVEGVLSRAGDVYSFGIMLYEMYTGTRAWAGSSQAQVIFAITCKGASVDMPTDAPPGYAELMKACTAADRDQRPTFDEVLKTLEALLAENENVVDKVVVVEEKEES